MAFFTNDDIFLYMLDQNKYMKLMAYHRSILFGVCLKAFRKDRQGLLQLA